VQDIITSNMGEMGEFFMDTIFHGHYNSLFLSA